MSCIPFLKNWPRHRIKWLTILTLTSTSLPCYAEVNPVQIGPLRPIGHTLQTPEAQKRIADLSARALSMLGSGATPQNTLPLQGLPKAFVSLGDSEPQFGIIVEKLHHRLSVVRISNNKAETVAYYRAITGKDPQDKIKRGDLRTPEGIYFVTGKIPEKQLNPRYKYGQMAFGLDYPNIYDRQQHKTGHGIWIHATEDAKRLLTPFDTEGCVVMTNEEIPDLEKYLIPFQTPVLITKEMTTGTAEELEKPRSLALNMIEAWRQSWQKSDFATYMGFYSKNFKTLGKNKSAWESYKNKLSELRQGNIKVDISNTKIIAFENQLLTVFEQSYSSPSYSDKGRKFLYLQWEGDRYRIIAEKWYPL